MSNNPNEPLSSVETLPIEITQTETLFSPIINNINTILQIPLVTHLDLRYIYRININNFKNFVIALENNQTLQYLDLSFNHIGDERVTYVKHTKIIRHKL